MDSIPALRARFGTGATRSYEARRDALRSLRRALLLHEEALLAAMHADMRKPRLEAYLSDIGLVLSGIDHALGNLRGWMRPERVPTPLSLQVASSSIHQAPLGVVLIIAPWNYPVLLLLSPLVAALAAGNCVVLKPSEDAPATARAIEALVNDALPRDLVTVVHGKGAEVVPALMRSHRFDHVFFTGSIPVGRQVMALAAENLVPVTLELGGKSPAIVDAKADVERAAVRIAWSKCFNAGQTCIATDYALVHESVRERFLVALKDTFRRFYGEDAQQSPHFARLIHERRFETVKGYLNQGEIFHGGGHDEADRYIAPTVLVSVDLGAQVMREEIFGPVLPVIPWREREEIVPLIERNPHPLAAYFFSGDRKAQRWFRENIACGGGCINHCMLQFGSSDLPFGGVGRSGMGRYHGRAGFDLFSNRKGLVHASTLVDPGLQYPPYSRLKERLLRWVFR